MQRRRVVQRRIDGRAVRQQQRHAIHVSAVGGVTQWRRAVDVAGIHLLKEND